MNNYHITLFKLDGNYENDEMQEDWHVSSWQKCEEIVKGKLHSVLLGWKLVIEHY